MIRAAGQLLLRVHRRLLPARAEIGWTPYLWLFYLSFFYWRWFFEPPTGLELAAGIAGVMAFLVLYFNGYWQDGPRVLLNMAGIVLIALLLVPVNPGAMSFFIYSAAFAGFCGRPQLGWYSLAGVLVAVLVATWIYSMPWYWTASTATLSLMIGAVNIYYAEVGRKNAALRRSQEEVERLASVAERERIARDLHDLLGHTLTVITVKAELARRLSDRGDARAKDEIADVERISREALQQVREAVAGFADVGLQGEMRRAGLVCEARDIALEVSMLAEPPAMPRRETALAMVLREAVTNVVRHSQATVCRVVLEIRDASLALVIEDNGRGAPGGGRGRASAGHGLKSMRERLVGLGGDLEVEGRLGDDGGFRVTATLPLDPEDALGLNDALACGQEKAERQGSGQATDGTVGALPEPA